MHHSVYHSKWLGRGNHWCGGTILDSWTVLSAAHCFFDAKNEEGIYGGREYVKKIQPYIKVGSINDVAEEAEAQVPIKSDKIFVRHQLDNIWYTYISPQFLKISEVEKVIWNDEKKYNVMNGGGLTYDFADFLVFSKEKVEPWSHNDIIIFKLKTPLKFNSKVQPACLPSAKWEPESNANCFVSGWGYLKFSEYLFSILPITVGLLYFDISNFTFWSVNILKCEIFYWFS